MTKTDAGSSTEIQLHPRFPPYIIDLLDKRAAEMQEEARRFAPKATVSRTDALVALVMSALSPVARRKK